MSNPLPEPVAWKCANCGNTSDCQGVLPDDNWCRSCAVCGDMKPLHDADQLRAHAAAELAAARDCRTCRNYSRYTATCWTLERHHHMAPCTNADRYERLLRTCD